jgi:hypothetical protein
MATHTVNEKGVKLLASQQNNRATKVDIYGHSREVNVLVYALK